MLLYLYGTVGIIAVPLIFLYFYLEEKDRGLTLEEHQKRLEQDIQIRQEQEARWTARARNKRLAKEREQEEMQRKWEALKSKVKRRK